MGLSPRKIGEGLYEPLAAINVTPLVDVMLVLLIIFMVTAPMLATGIKVNLPSARTAQPLENKEPVVVAVAKDGAVSVGKDPVSRDELAARVKAKLGDSNGVVQLRGDRDAPYGDVVSVMDDLAASGISRIAIVSGPRRPIAPGSVAPTSASGLGRAEAVIAATLDGGVFEPPPVRPPWLRPAVIAIVLALHAAALSIVYLEPRPVAPLPEVVVDIEPEAPAAENPTRRLNSRSRRNNPRRRRVRRPFRRPPSRRQSQSLRLSPRSLPRRMWRRNLRRRRSAAPTPAGDAPSAAPRRGAASAAPAGDAAARPRRGAATPAGAAAARSSRARAAASPASAAETGRGPAGEAPAAKAPRARARSGETGGAAGAEARRAENRRAETGPGGIPLRHSGLARRAFDRRAVERRGERFVAFGV